MHLPRDEQRQHGEMSAKGYDEGWCMIIFAVTVDDAVILRGFNFQVQSLALILKTQGLSPQDSSPLELVVEFLLQVALDRTMNPQLGTYTLNPKARGWFWPGEWRLDQRRAGTLRFLVA